MKAFSPHSSALTSDQPRKLTSSFQRFGRTIRKINFKSVGLAVALLAAVSVTTLAANSPVNMWFTQAAEKSTVTYTADQLVNEDGQNYTEGSNWFGVGENKSQSYAGFHFTGEPLPPGATITKIELKVTAKQDSWISQATRIYVQNSATSEKFSSASRPSQRPKSADSVKYSDNSQWKAGAEYTLPNLNKLAPVLQAHRGSFSLILQGTGNAWGRKFVEGIDSRPPKIVVTYLPSGTTPTPSPAPAPTATPVVTPTPTPPQSPAPTPTPPGATPSPSPQPTPTPPMGGGSGGLMGNSQAMAAWNPTRFDTCPNAADTIRIKDIHAGYSVIGPDGKRYPTWHPPVDPTTGCKFGHEHGRSPVGYEYWDEVRRNFAFDADSNGQISTTELATAGVPFGYVNEQMVLQSHGMMRHEDHVGHKVEFANGEGDIGEGTDPFDSNVTGGVVVPVKNNTLSKWSQSGIRCYHFHKVHQGVSTPDAFTNNLHEVIIHTKCSSTRQDFPASTTLFTGMIPFGAPGEFTRFCGDDRNQIIVTGKTDANANWPGTRGSGMRNIGDRSCVEQTVLVPEGQWSSFPYEIWTGSFVVRTNTGREIASMTGPGWEVLDAIRYYDPNATNRISYAMDYCYQTNGTRRARGGSCMLATNYGLITGITWDDPRSAFRGLSRGQYIVPHQIANGNGSTYWYTDAFGGNAQTTPFPGSIRQIISPVNARITFDMDPRIVLREHSDGNRSVHGPN